MSLTFTRPGSLLPEEANAQERHVIAQIVGYHPSFALELDEWFERTVGCHLGHHYQLTVSNREENLAESPNKGRKAPPPAVIAHHDLVITTAASEATVCATFTAAVERMWQGDPTKVRTATAKPGETLLLIKCSFDPNDDPIKFLLRDAFTEVLTKLPAPEPLAAK